MTPSMSPKMMSPGMTITSPQLDGALEVDDGRAIGGVDGTEPGAEDGEAHLQDAGHVARVTVEQAAGGAAGAGGGGEELTPEAGALGAVGRRHHDVARLERIDGGDLLFVGVGRSLVDVGGEHGVGATDQTHGAFDGPDAGGHGLLVQPLAVEDVRDDSGVEARAEGLEELVVTVGLSLRRHHPLLPPHGGLRPAIHHRIAGSASGRPTAALARAARRSLT